MADEHDRYRQAIHRRVDRALDGAEHARLEKHLETCPACRAYADRLTAFERRLQHEFIPREAVVPHRTISSSLLLATLRRRRARRAMAYRAAALLAAVAIITALAVFVPPERFMALIPGLVPTPTPFRPPTPAPLDIPGALIFTSWETGNPDIYQINADGSGQRNLTSLPAWDLAPRLSPDGKTLAFVSNRGETAGIYLMNLADRTVTPLLRSEDSKTYWSELAFSPDGTVLAAVEATSLEFFVQRGDSAGQSTFDSYGAGTLYAIHLTDGSQTRISADRQLAWNPQWTPDGSRIFFQCLEYNYARIYSARADGSGLHVLGTPGGADEQGAFAITPDGQQIAYFQFKRSRGSIHPDQLLISNLDATNLTIWKEFPNTHLDPGRLVIENTMRFSPDGTRLAYTWATEGGETALRLLERATGRTLLLFTGITPQTFSTPAWSPDGQRLAVVSDGKIIHISGLMDPPAAAAPGEDPNRAVEVYENHNQFGPGDVQWLPEVP